MAKVVPAAGEWEQRFRLSHPTGRTAADHGAKQFGLSGTSLGWRALGISLIHVVASIVNFGFGLEFVLKNGFHDCVHRGFGSFDGGRKAEFSERGGGFGTERDKLAGTKLFAKHGD